MYEHPCRPTNWSIYTPNSIHYTCVSLFDFCVCVCVFGVVFFPGGGEGQIIDLCITYL